MIKKQILIPLIALPTIVIFTASYFFFSSRSKPSALPTSTGAIIETPAPSKQLELETFASLQNRLPLTTVDFIIDFDYQNDKFVVHFIQSTQSAIPNFLQWIKANNYGSIPSDQFVFTTYQP